MDGSVLKDRLVSSNFTCNTSRLFDYNLHEDVLCIVSALCCSIAIPLSWALLASSQALNLQWSYIINLRVRSCTLLETKFFTVFLRSNHKTFIPVYSNEVLHGFLKSNHKIFISIFFKKYQLLITITISYKYI